MLTQIIISATIISLASAAFTNLVRDPSFQERFPSRCSKFCTIRGGYSGDQYSDQFRWTSNDGKLEFYRKASDRTASIDLNTDKASIVAQLVKGFEPGQTYELSFDVNRNTDCGPTTKTGTAYVNAYDLNTEMSFSVDTDQWQRKQLSFVALATEHRINFRSTTPDACGPLIDNVVVKVINLVKNPKFDSPTTVYKTSKKPSVLFPDGSWTTDGDANAELYEKNQMDLVSETPYTLKQTVRGFKVGSQYQLEVVATFNGDCGKPTNRMLLTVVAVGAGFAGSDNSQTFSVSTSTKATISMSFKASKTSHDIKFGSTANGKCGALISNVVVRLSV